MKSCGNLLSVHYADSDKYLGVLSQPVLCQLLAEYTVHLEGSLIVSTTSSHTVKSKSRVKKAKVESNYSVRILISGLKGDKSAIAVLLSDACLYLQHPSVNELDGRLDYCNPHYLVRPGGQLPKLEELLSDSQGEARQRPNTLDNALKTQFMQIFDTADGRDIDWDVQPSKSLKTDLMEYVVICITTNETLTLSRHQLKALAMMLEKERGVIPRPQFPPLWEYAPENNELAR